MIFVNKCIRTFVKKVYIGLISYYYEKQQKQINYIYIYMYYKISNYNYYHTKRLHQLN